VEEVMRVKSNEHLSWLQTLSERELIEIVTNPENALQDTLRVEQPRDSFGRMVSVDQSTFDHIVGRLRPRPKHGQAATIDELGSVLLTVAITGHWGGMYAFPPRYWWRLKEEFKSFVCGRNKRYASLKKKLAASANKSQTALVSTIAAGMAAQFGVAAGVLVPFVALCLVVLARVGKEAFCATVEWDMPLRQPKRRPRPKRR
jgi:hypothetical protein